MTKGTETMSTKTTQRVKPELDQFISGHSCEEFEGERNPTAEEARRG